jgi:hypothetical protein
MITLTSNISIPNINRIRVKKVAFDQDATTAFIDVLALMVGGNTYSPYQIQIANGSSVGLRANAAPTGATDELQLFSLTTATGYTTVFNAYNGNGSNAVKNQAVETALISLGAVPTGTVS